MPRFDFQFISKVQILSPVNHFADFLPKDLRQWLALWGVLMEGSRLAAPQATHRTEKGDRDPYAGQLEAGCSKRREEWLNYRAWGHTLKVGGCGERREGGERRRKEEEKE